MKRWVWPKLDIEPDQFAIAREVFRRRGVAFASWIETLSAEEAFAVGQLVGAILKVDLDGK